ncbi:MAG: hypothetical protein N2712_00210 [Brevinematales bacterium]|nr:hypothetical protein [Brevinematales bacterium]
MVKVGIVSGSVVLSRVIGIVLISKGYYVNHIFPDSIDNNKNFDVFILDFDGIKKLNSYNISEIIDKITLLKKHLILITSEKEISKLKEFLSKGIIGIVDSSLKTEDISERIYEILQTLPLVDDDKRKHYRVKVDYGILKVEILPNKIIEGKIFDISAGGVSANFSTEEEANMFINNKSYPCEVIFGNIVIKTKIFLVRRDRLFCGFKFFGLDYKQLIRLSEFIYHSIIEATYSNQVLSNSFRQ